jgi:hypothetical protein
LVASEILVVFAVAEVEPFVASDAQFRSGRPPGEIEVAAVCFDIDVVAVSSGITFWKGRASPNTVYLSDNDGVAVDDWRVAVMRVFELVARHFAFDDAGIGTGAARR